MPQGSDEPSQQSDAVKSTHRIKVVLSRDVAAKVAAAAARVTFTKEQALQIASAEPQHATIFSGSLRKASARQRAGSDFVATCVRSGVKWRRTQDAFLTQYKGAVDRAVRDGGGISAQELLKRVDDRLDEARLRLSSRLSPSR